MKRRQPHCREGDVEAINKRREAIVDRALLYARLLSILDKRRKEDDEGETAVAETDHGVSQQTSEKQQSPPGHDNQASQTLASEINALHR